MIKKTIYGEELAVKVAGECLRFADDKALLSSTAKGLQTFDVKVCGHRRVWNEN